TSANIISWGDTDQFTSGLNAQPGLAQGQSGEGAIPSQGGPPPQEAIFACVGLDSSATCAINTPNGTLNGTCSQIETQLACVPEGGSPGGNGL
ncbi:MAG: hypothetical protein ABFS17_13255, partial [Chloroflexota bacterium]